ncbi:MAG: FeS assembly protein SufB [Microgenomates group bacterium GW2011_GWF2_45_18]|nr:MAG: FeS assembly protein SufB [Microgenomates group bacterium GW2011_GWF1_44_10]KKU02139.1 MAG: FeS assembly protein SufB [Microgenomates group bacterium GW2011_GWF2_45_18]OGJ41780.1 MAG: Fe-S cluster assembly protein SufB [Candidatus Pacebacteria bacterium RIFOXYB1_FULL_44_10]HAU98689.1 Fe-S cluster assembly protein SufB [Candidatus Paceibacterota bacterium]HAX01885.1 Fe-S cluster assembly protein SufB [Candidatus Paceibacterota bacterium]
MKQLPSIQSPTYTHGFSVPLDYAYISERGLTKKTIETLSSMKAEPEWMKKFRLDAYALYLQKTLPSWGPDLSSLSFDDIRYYVKPTDGEKRTWDDVPDSIKKTFDRLGTPQAEREYLAGIKNQFDSEVVQGQLKPIWEEKGVIFLSMDEALKKHPNLVRKHIGSVIPSGDNVFASLNSAVWSGGSFIYVPKNVEVSLPLQAYFRINAERAGQFERTLIIADEGSKVTYIEGCTSPSFSTSSLHSAVVEIIVEKGAHVEYITIQNWYKHVYNLVTKRALVKEEAVMVWTDCNLGSKITMKYPSYILAGKAAHGETLSLAFAGANQIQDTGSKAIHLAPYTTSSIVSKSISQGGGITSYRGLISIGPNAHHAKNHVSCDALLLDKNSISNTYPTQRVFTGDATITHEATVSKIGERQLFYLMSRGLTASQARAMIVRGFADPLIKKLPMEYAVELNRFIDLEMEGSVG